MRQKMVSYVDLPVGEVKERFVGHLDRSVEESGGITEIEVKKGKEEIRGKAAKTKELSRLSKEGELLVAKYHTDFSSQLQPVYVEEPIELHVKLPVKVTGYIDLVAEPVQTTMLDSSPRTIIDRKRSARAQVQPEWRIQAEIYQLAMPYPFSWHISQPGKGILVPKTPEDELLQPLGPRDITLRFLEQVIAEVGLYYQRYGPDEPWPTRGKLHPWACNYCGFRPQCVGWMTTTKGKV